MKFLTEWKNHPFMFQTTNQIPVSPNISQMFPMGPEAGRSHDVHISISH
jgi:hypothetical protein